MRPAVHGTKNLIAVTGNTPRARTNAIPGTNPTTVSSAPRNPGRLKPASRLAQRIEPVSAP